MACKGTVLVALGNSGTWKRVFPGEDINDGRKDGKGNASFAIIIPFCMDEGQWAEHVHC